MVNTIGGFERIKKILPAKLLSIMFSYRSHFLACVLLKVKFVSDLTVGGNCEFSVVSVIDFRKVQRSERKSFGKTECTFYRFIIGYNNKFLRRRQKRKPTTDSLVGDTTTLAEKQEQEWRQRHWRSRQKRRRLGQLNMIQILGHISSDRLKNLRDVVFQLQQRQSLERLGYSCVVRMDQ